ncbi:MAG: squalene--hopene cyclase [Kiritimatiellia bacterium]|nr:squalene--hopene cyclase [Kiritimatiellia bacterium]
MNVFLSFFTFLFVVSLASGQEPGLITLANVPPAKRIVADEQIRKSFSAEQAARYLDNASLAWQKQQNCVTCHTSMTYLMARPALSSTLKDSGEVREFFESYYMERWEKGKKYPKQVYNPVVVGTALAFHDAQTSGILSDTTRQVLDMMWTTQRSDGGWNWAKCGWAPMEIDDHFGVTLAALAVGIAPGNYAESDAAKAGMEKIRRYLRNNRASSLHHRIMITWASVRVSGLMEEPERKKVLEELLSKQLPDGGWSTPSFLIDWEEYKRKDGKPHDPNTSDSYGTGLAIVVAREMGIPAGKEGIQKGITWLKTNQRQSGKFFTRSPVKDSKHYITNTGTAYAVLALQACGELPGWPFGE